MAQKKVRKAISKKLRFEIFKRDKFTCQYCGEMSPKVILEVDHINPVFNNGDNDVLNLITSCYSCNRGKGKRKLSDESEIEKQSQELKSLMDKKEQLEMMIEYREELKKIKETELQYCVGEIEDLFECEISEQGLKTLKTLVRKYDINTILESATDCIEYYKNANKAFSKIEQFIKNKKNWQANPITKEYSYCVKMLKNNLSYVGYEAFNMIKDMDDIGVDINDIKSNLRKIYTWNDFKDYYYSVMGK